MRLPRRTPFALAVILGLYLILGAWHITLTPMFEKGDEEFHTAYVVHLLEQERLPPLVIDADLNPAYQIAGHPPLYYALSALLLRGLGLRITPPELVPNPFWGYPAPGTAPDNKNRFLHTPEESRQGKFEALYLLRWFSLVLGLGTIIAAYGIARALSGQVVLGLMSAALVAILPQYTFIASAISNDALVASLSGLGLLALVHATMRGESWRHWILFGLTAGLAALTKANALLLPIFGAGVAIVLGMRRRSMRMAIMGVVASLGLWLAICGWWYLRNTILFNDPLGTGVHITQYGQETSLGRWNLSNLWLRTSVTFWGAFGWSNVQFPPWVYLTLRTFETLALAGLLWIVLRRRHQISNRPAWYVATGYTVLMVLAYVWWTTTVHGTLGRLSFPVLAPLAFFFCAGLKQWSTGLMAAVWAFVATMALLAPAFIVPAYQPTPVVLQAQAANDLKPLRVTFSNLANLFAVQVAPQRITPGESVRVTLCWEPLHKTDSNYVLFVQVLADGDKKVGERNTYPGLGRYPTSQWQPGRPFCDEVEVPIQQATAANAVYSVATGLYDPATGQNLSIAGPDGQSIGLLVIDQIKVIGPSAPLPDSASLLDANFADQIMLAGYEFEPTDDTHLVPLTLYWQARRPIEINYTVFLHVLNSAGQLVAQVDSPPQQGRYPTGWWDTHEIVADTHILELSNDLPPGTYRVLVGLYELETGKRLTLVETGKDSQELPPLRIQS